MNKFYWKLARAETINYTIPLFVMLFHDRVWERSIVDLYDYLRYDSLLFSTIEWLLLYNVKRPYAHWPDNEQLFNKKKRIAILSHLNTQTTIDRLCGEEKTLQSVRSHSCREIKSDLDIVSWFYFVSSFCAHSFYTFCFFSCLFLFLILRVSLTIGGFVLNTLNSKANSFITDCRCDCIAVCDCIWREVFSRYWV